MIITIIITITITITIHFYTSSTEIWPELARNMPIFDILQKYFGHQNIKKFHDPNYQLQSAHSYRNWLLNMQEK